MDDDDMPHCLHIWLLVVDYLTNNNSPSSIFRKINLQHCILCDEPYPQIKE